MPKSPNNPPEPRLPLLVIAFVAATGLFGFAFIFYETLKPADLYPAYSSMRTDPLGTKAFYESLESMDAFSLERCFLPLTQFKPSCGSDQTGVLLVVGLDAEYLNQAQEAEIEALEAMVHKGWRAVVALRPKTKLEASEKNKKQDEEEGGDQRAEEQKAAEAGESETAGPGKPERDEAPGKTGKSKKPELASKFFKKVKLEDRWEFKIKVLEKGSEEGWDLARPSDATPASEEFDFKGGVPIYSRAVLETFSEEWRPVLLRQGHLVGAEKKMGKGSLVLLADSYGFSNQALAEDPPLSFLLWCLDGKKHLVFDETHHGIQASPGVISLARSLHLEGLFLGLVVLAALYIWKVSSAFPPLPVPASALFDPHPETLSGRDKLDGLASLLRRSIRPGDLLRLCLEEYRQQRGAQHPDRLESLAEPPDGEDVASRFNQIQAKLTQRKPL